MLMAGANGLQREVDGLTPAHFAAIAGNLDTFRELPIASYTMSDHIASRAPIHYAALCGKMDILDYLLTEISELDRQTELGSSRNPGWPLCSVRRSRATTYRSPSPAPESLAEKLPMQAHIYRQTNTQAHRHALRQTDNYSLFSPS
eukprot:sb/3473892/